MGDDDQPRLYARGVDETEVLTAPGIGQLTVSEGSFYPNYVQPNPRSVCDARKVPGKQAFYVADAAFRGHDRLALRNATSEGRMRRVVIDIDVR